jgi:ABC-type Fe3+ transport system substrate-binding protein
VLSRRAFLTVAALGGVAVVSAGAAAAGPRALREVVWSRQWDDLVAAARAERTLSLVTWADTWGGPGYGGFGATIRRFEQAFPGVVVDPWLAESSASVWLARARAVRRAGQPIFDLALVQTDAALKQGAPDGLWAPIRPLLFRPDVLDDAVWRGGFDARFLDASGVLCFGWEHQVLHAYAVNTDLVHDGDIASLEDLLDPTWTGKVLSSDPRVGIGLSSAASVAASRGAEAVRRLLVDQRPAFSSGGRHLAESVLSRRYPIVLGLRPKALQPFAGRAAIEAVRFLDLPEADVAATTSLLYFDRAPHPAAARLFANWVLTQEGQTILTSNLPTNSARLDVAPSLIDGVGAAPSYYEPEREANYQPIADTQRLVRDLVGSIQFVG